MTAVKEKIKTMLEAGGDFNNNDILVNLSTAAVLPFKIGSTYNTKERTLKNLLDVAKRFEKETGSYPLCVSKGSLLWNKGEKSLQTPILLIPCKPQINKINGEVSINLNEDDAFVNPYLLKRLKNEFELDIEGSLIWEDIVNFLKNNGLDQLDRESCFIGNFHHHRYDILRELEELVIADDHAALEELFGEVGISANSSMNLLSSSFLEPADPDQLAVFEKINTHHLVIQGPPGTGKSQVLTNLIGKILHGNQTALIVSEKRVALEVLVKKMRQLGLEDFSFIASSTTRSLDLLADLKSNWQRLEQREPKKESSYIVSSQLIEGLQQTLDTLQKDNLIGGISYAEFIAQSSNLSLNKSTFSSDLPTIKEWLKVRETIENFYTKNINGALSSLSASYIYSPQFSQLDLRIKEWLKELEDLSVLFQLQTWGDVSKAMKLAALSHFYGSATFKKYAELLNPETKKYKRFLNLSKKYLKVAIEIEGLEIIVGNWKQLPTEEELDVLKVQSIKTGFLKTRKFKRTWTKYSALTNEKAIELIEKQLHFYQLKSDLQKHRLELLELGIEDPINEIPFIKQQLAHYSTADERVWIALSEDQRSALASSNNSLNTLYSNLKTYFRLKEDQDLKSILNSLLLNFERIVQSINEKETITDQVLKYLGEFASFKHYEAAVYKSSYVKFIGQFPSFENFTAEKMLEKCGAIFTEQERESKLLVNEITLQQFEQFNRYQSILKSAPAKLSEEEKIFRSELKKGKAILVKAFSKTRNLPTLRELFASEARHWITLLKPIWLSNPAQVAKHFPLQKDLFQHCVFDEASQIPLQNSLGSIYRSKHVTVAGDGQQMSPSNYFNSTSFETIDLLHQAGFYWKNVWLKHHYRSEHPGLIAFSNKHFYKDELLAFPTVKSEKNPVDVHCIEGVYLQGENPTEAKAVAKKIEALIDFPETLGVVAFSESQLAAIYEQLSEKTKGILSERIENDTAFFKALENVQGDECDYLVISFGYGKDADGKFYHRFGPLSQKGGARRLNVLFSRAKKHIDYFTSVKSTDFRLSINEATDLIRRYLQAAEADEFNQSENFFFEKMNARREKNTIVFSQPYQTFKSAQELLTIVRVLKNRGWELKFQG
jgi:DNA polymerase III delta prime subunit